MARYNRLLLWNYQRYKHRYGFLSFMYGPKYLLYFIHICVTGWFSSLRWCIVKRLREKKQTHRVNTQEIRNGNGFEIATFFIHFLQTWLTAKYLWRAFHAISFDGHFMFAFFFLSFYIVGDKCLQQRHQWISAPNTQIYI